MEWRETTGENRAVGKGESVKKITDVSAKSRSLGSAGRRHTEEQVNAILDHYLLTGEVPEAASKKQQWNYRMHKRLSERRILLRKAGHKVTR